MYGTVMLWRAWPGALALVSCLFVLPRCPWPKADAAQHAKVPLAEESWRDVRAQLNEASIKRRSGDREGALARYRSVLAAPVAHDMDRERAKYWHARLRIENGEQSALFELEKWVSKSRDPMLLARTAQLARREAWHASSHEWASLLNRLYSASIGALEKLSVVHDENGERAKRWLASLSK